MGENSKNGITYYLRVKKAHQGDLANIRPWTDLKVGFDEEYVWIKDFNFMQINSLEVKSMPYKTVYYTKDGKLHLQGSLLPDRNVPSLVWTRMDRALPVELPRLNHNFFGLEERVSTKLIPSEKEEKAVALLTTMDALRAYVESAPAIRLQPLRWTIVNGDWALIFGTPLLPLQGDTYWQHGNLLIPTGYDFDLHILRNSIDKLLNPNQDLWIVWNRDSTWFDLQKTDVVGLSISSLRLSV